jgi:hypothetical protein
MWRRVPIVLGMLACGAAAVFALGLVMESKLAAVPKVMAWLGLFVSGAACLLLVIIGLMRNTRDARSAGQQAAAAQRPAFFPMAPDPSVARDAAELLRVPAETRDDAWETRFYGTVAAAALEPADPPQFTGPDGMPYAAFRLAGDSTGARQLSFTTVAETLTERGLGAVLNPQPDKTADWVFTTGDMVSLRLFGRIIPAPREQQQPPDAALDREVLAGSPSEALLPSYARAAIRAFMQGTLGIANPAVFLISDVALQPPESLVFNISGHQLAEGWTEQSALRFLHWFLPQHYRTISVPADSALARHFQPL